MSCSPRKLRFGLWVLGALQVVTVLLALERPAHAYIDPGSGFVLMQVVGSMFAGAVYYTRHRIKRLLFFVRRSPLPTAPGTTEAVENQQ
jgi:hypothetical protein